MPKRIRCYNQYPGLYKDILSMRDDLSRIRALGFEQVWINPIFTPCQTNPIPNMSDRIHSPYAMQNETISSRYAATDDVVKEYTKTARDLGLMPIFDLVAKHVAIDHRFVTGDSELMEKHRIDTRKWFKRHNNGHLMLHNMDEHYNPLTDNPWADVASFNYDDPQIMEEIITYFWKPFLRYNIVDLGFRGIRIDAPGLMPPHVIPRLIQLAKQYCHECQEDNPIIIAETVGRGSMDSFLTLKDTATHTMNSSFWMPGPDDGAQYDLWRQDANWFADNKGLLQQTGPTVGFPGSHDTARAIQQFKDKGITDRTTLEKRMLEKIAVTAFSSDGGWILQYGDEFGASKAVNVFETTPIEYHLNGELQFLNCSDFVYQINQTIQQLPKPTFPEWSQRIFMESNPDLVIFLVHQGKGFSGPSFVIVANTNKEKQVSLTEENLREIMLANGRNTAPELRQLLPNTLYLCGSIEPHQSLVRCLGESAIYSSKTTATFNPSLFQNQSNTTDKQPIDDSPHI